MKRFASHRVCFLHNGQIVKKQVVEIDETTGVVSSVFPFVEEISFTEWLGGIILISSSVPSIVQGEKFSDFVTRFAASGEGELKAYFVSDFNLVDMEFTPKSRILQLGK